LQGEFTKDKYPSVMRRVEALVEVRGEMKKMVFITNNLKWSAWTVAELYRARWGIETFFKELKETVQLVDFLGYNRSAVCWQIWRKFAKRN
jgi:IS4 transposase